MVGGGVIIAGACLIMFPDFLGYFGSIFRLLTMVLVAVLVAAFVVRAFYKVKSGKTATQANPDQAEPSAMGAGTDTKSDT